MKHLFTSGEIIYSKNKKILEQGVLTAESIAYETVDEDSWYTIQGEIDRKAAVVKFKIKSDFLDDFKFRYSIKILMQSDLVQAEWEEYEIEYT